MWARMPGSEAECHLKCHLFLDSDPFPKGVSPAICRKPASILRFRGAPGTNRTCDPPLRRGMLYPLSYGGVRPHSTEAHPRDARAARGRPSRTRHELSPSGAPSRVSWPPRRQPSSQTRFHARIDRRVRAEVPRADQRAPGAAGGARRTRRATRDPAPRRALFRHCRSPAGARRHVAAAASRRALTCPGFSSI